MKKLSTLFTWVLLTGVASAAPYVVYSGTSKTTVATSSGTTTQTSQIYLVTDLADTSSYGILQYNPTTKQGEISIYPLTSPTAVESNLNFFGGIDSSNGHGGTAILSIGDITTDSSSNTDVTHAYATGALGTGNTLLASARSVWSFTTRTNGVTTGTVSFPATASIYSGTITFPHTLSGTTLAYTIASTGSLTSATGQGAISLTLDSTFTKEANIGGDYPDTSSYGPRFALPQNLFAVHPISEAGTTAAEAYTTWLENVATALGVTIPAPAVITGIDGGDGGASLTVVGGGTEILGGSNTYSGGTSIGGGTLNIGNGNTDGTLTVTGSVTPTNGGALTLGSGGGTSNTGSITGIDTVNTGGTATLTLTGSNTYSGSTTISSGLILNTSTGTTTP